MSDRMKGRRKTPERRVNDRGSPIAVAWLAAAVILLYILAAVAVFS